MRFLPWPEKAIIAIHIDFDLKIFLTVALQTRTEPIFIMRRPSILFVNRVYPPYRGATGRVLRDLARGFAREGWQVYVLSTGTKFSKERDGAIKVMRVKGPKKPGSKFGYVLSWLKMFRAMFWLPKTDVIVTMTDPPMLNVIGHYVSKARRSQHIHWCQDLYPDLLEVFDIKLPVFFQRFLHRLSRRSMQKAAKNIVIGRCMAKHLSYTGLNPQNITVIPNWPDHELRYGDDRPPEYIEIPAVDGSKSYEELLKSGPKFRVLYAGTIGLAHPHDIIVDAAEILAQSNPEIEFVFVGEGQGFDVIAQERINRNLHNVRMLPYQPNSRLKEIMESGDVHLISMKEKAAGCLVPSKLYSALAVGRPTIFIGPENCETAKVIHDFKAGQVIHQGDARLLANTILQYRNSGEHWFAAHEGAGKAGQVFVPEESIDAWIKRANDVVNHKKKMAA